MDIIENSPVFLFFTNFVQIKQMIIKTAVVIMILVTLEWQLKMVSSSWTLQESCSFIIKLSYLFVYIENGCFSKAVFLGNVAASLCEKVCVG